MEPGVSYVKTPVIALKSLCTVKPHPDRGFWTVYCYVLNRDLSTTDESHGILMILGVYDTKRDAEERAKMLTQKTGVSISIVELGCWVELKLMRDLSTTTKIHTDTEGKLVHYATQENEHHQKLYEEQKAREKALLDESLSESDTSTISYYKAQWLKLLRYQSKRQTLQEELKELEGTYSTCVEEIQKHHQKFPTHDHEWLSYLNALEYTPKQIDTIRERYHDLRPRVLPAMDESKDLSPPIQTQTPSWNVVGKPRRKGRKYRKKSR